ncbi:reticulon family protein [Candidatus Bathyarchaeota archaeon]|nr:reticulon family protein [Candidatus Bathyarchaeota archaeon]
MREHWRLGRGRFPSTLPLIPCEDEESPILIFLQAFVATFLSYYLVKVVPYWVLAVIGTTVAFAAPLIYTANKELIDEQLKNASDVVNAQTSQLRDAAGKQTAHVTDLTKQYMGDYSAKAQGLIRGRAASPGGTPASPTADGPAEKFPAAPTHVPEEVLREADFPSAPEGDVSADAAKDKIAEVAEKIEADGAPVEDEPLI